MNDKLIYQKAREVYTAYLSCKELRRSINIKTAISLILTTLWYYIWFTSAISYFSKPWATFNAKNMLMYISVLVIILAPLRLFKIHKWLKFKPFVGIITDSKYTVLHMTKGSNKKYIDFNVASIDKKKKIKCKIEAKDGILNYFKNETPVLFLRGLEYPIKLSIGISSQNNVTSFCSCCGTFNPNHYDRCFECSTLLWNKEL